MAALRRLSDLCRAAESGTVGAMSDPARRGVFFQCGGAGPALLCAVLACGAPRVDKPPAPDMSELVQAYAAPSARFAPADAAEIAAAVTVLDELLERTSLRAELLDVLDEVLDQAVDISTEGDGRFELDIEADGYMRVTRICSGWAEVSKPDREENGTMQVTATFSESGLDPIVWGSADACRYLSGGARVELDHAGDDVVSVYWGESVEAGELEQRALLVDLDVGVRIEDQPLGLGFDFRSLADGTLEYRLERPDGDLIAVISERDGLTVRAENGVFECDAELECGRLPEAEGR